jgi:hypothetical protein
MGKFRWGEWTPCRPCRRWNLGDIDDQATAIRISENDVDEAASGSIREPRNVPISFAPNLQVSEHFLKQNK